MPADAVPLLDWLEAWATAMIVDGRADAVCVGGAATLVDGAALAALLRRIDAAVRSAGGAFPHAIDLFVGGAGGNTASVTIALQGPGGRGVGSAELIRIHRERRVATTGDVPVESVRADAKVGLS